MAIGFNESRGGAQSGRFDNLKYESNNRIRLFGGLRAKYDYWIKNPDGKARPFECLQFMPEDGERFDKNAPDPVGDVIRERNLQDDYGKPLTCRWSYAMLCYNYNTGKIEIITFKKTLFDSIMSTTTKFSKKTGKPVDPTSLGEDGFDITFTKEKTGPQRFDVKYEVDPYIELSAVSPEIAEKMNEAPSVDEVMPRYTVESQREALAKWLGDTVEAPMGSAEADALSEFGTVSDLPS